jgi:tetratricopeptide (TPR) repeat protein
MKKALLIVFVLMYNLVSGQDYKSLVSKAAELYNSKDYKQSMMLYKDAFKIEQKNDDDLYFAACAAAMAGENKLAIKWLKKALSSGGADVYYLKTDPDLKNLHNTKEWDKLMASVQKETDKREVNYNKPLQRELLAIFEEDQKYRGQMDSVEAKFGQKSDEMNRLWKITNDADSVNLFKVKAILDVHGWVGKDKIGDRANLTLFLVIQHSDIKTQQQYLPMMREAVKNKDASGSALSMLEDRIAIREGMRQIYGSQIGMDPETSKYYVAPLEDPDNVDKRRESVGLGLMSEYVREWGIIWNVEEYKKQLCEIEEKEKKRK